MVTMENNGQVGQITIHKAHAVSVYTETSPSTHRKNANQVSLQSDWYLTEALCKEVCLPTVSWNPFCYFCMRLVIMC